VWENLAGQAGAGFGSNETLEWIFKMVRFRLTGGMRFMVNYLLASGEDCLAFEDGFPTLDSVLGCLRVSKTEWSTSA